GPWALNVGRTDAGLVLSWGLAPMTTHVGRTPVDGPHAIFGVARGSLLEASAALGSYVVNGLRHGRPLTPQVTYHTWFAYGTRVNYQVVRGEIERAATVGAELFVLDAGWYADADTKDMWDFDSGLGSWQPDAGRFPDGLKPLRDYAHSVGLKFGLWVEPERVSLLEVGGSGVDEGALASSGGAYGSDHAAQICLAGAAGRQWVMDRLTALIDAV